MEIQILKKKGRKKKFDKRLHVRLNNEQDAMLAFLMKRLNIHEKGEIIRIALEKLYNWATNHGKSL